MRCSMILGMVSVWKISGVSTAMSASTAFTGRQIPFLHMQPKFVLGAFSVVGQRLDSVRRVTRVITSSACWNDPVQLSIRSKYS